MSAVLSCGVTPLSGSFRLDSGPTDRLVRVGMAAAKILVSQIQMETLHDNASLQMGMEVSAYVFRLAVTPPLSLVSGGNYRDLLQMCVLSSVLLTKDATFAVVCGPIGGDRV